MADSPADSGTVFISYSHQDAAYLARLQQYLAPYVRSGAIPLWDDTQIKPGADWKRGIERALDAARVALLLVSVGFLASEFVAKEELPRLLAAAEARGTRILPVILTPCLFRRTTLSRFQAINDPARPLSGLSQHEQDLVWERVVEAVLDALDTPANSEPPPEPAPRPAPAAPTLVPASAPRRRWPAPDPAPFAPRAAPPYGPARASIPQPPQPAPAQRPQPGTLLLTCQGHAMRVNCVAWAPDGERLASASTDGTVRVWDAASGRHLLPCSERAGVVLGVAWAPDGARLASASEDKTVRVWDAAGGKQLLACQGHKGVVFGVAWAPDGERLASAGEDGTVRVWYVG